METFFKYTLLNVLFITSYHFLLHMNKVIFAYEKIYPLFSAQNQLLKVLCDVLVVIFSNAKSRRTLICRERPYNNAL